MDALLLSFGIIFVAELGDKSQLMALMFAARYKALPILIGIIIATAVVHAFSVVVGAALGVAMPTRAVNVIAGLAFLAFAAWTLRGDRLDDDEASPSHDGVPRRAPLSPTAVTDVAVGGRAPSDRASLVGRSGDEALPRDGYRRCRARNQAIRAGRAV